MSCIVTFFSSIAEVAPGRFLSDHLKARECSGDWTTRFLSYFLYLLRTGKLKKESLIKKYQDVRYIKTQSPEGDGSVRLQAKRVKLTHAAARNQAEVAFLAYGDVNLKYRERIKVEVRQPYAYQHSQENSTLRTTDATAKYEARAVNGSLYYHLNISSTSLYGRM